MIILSFSCVKCILNLLYIIIFLLQNHILFKIVLELSNLVTYSEFVAISLDILNHMILHNK